MKKNPEFTVTTATTLLPFLLASLTGKSRNYVKGALGRGQITVNGKVVTDYAHALSPGASVGINMSATPQFNMSLPIIYEDDELLVIDKPAGMLSVSTDTEKENTAYHIATDYVKSRTTGGVYNGGNNKSIVPHKGFFYEKLPTKPSPKDSRLFIVHRLDRDTSGVLLFAKSEKLKLELQENWEENARYRGYTAVVEGSVTPAQGSITSWLKQTKTLLVYSSDRDGDGKLAITNYAVRQANNSYSLLDISLETGRKNQIRVHMKDLGFPVVGDRKYGAKTDPLKRLGLHAHLLTIKHPVTEKEMTFEAKTPKSFISLCAKQPNN